MTYSTPLTAPNGQVIIWAVGGGRSVTLALAADPTINPVVGGWQNSARFGRAPATWWSGPEEPGSAEMLLAADARLTPNFPDVVATVTTLTSLGAPVDGSAQPPTVQVICNATPTLDNVDMVVQDLALGAQVVTGGRLLRQEVTLSLQRYEPFAPLTSVKPTQSRSASNKRRARVISAKTGDTLRSIAVRQLGDASRWKDIRSWNKSLAKVDPDAPLRTGTKVTLR